MEWAKPQDRQNANVRYVDVTNQGTETFAAVTAAYASLSVALKPFEDTNDLTRKLLESAERTFKVLQRSVRSYASLAENAALAQSWPSTEALLADDKLLAAGMMLLATGRQEYRCAVWGVRFRKSGGSWIFHFVQHPRLRALPEFVCRKMRSAVRGIPVYARRGLSMLG